ncbi:hypothetical protein J3R30DRAFT_69113 [Lentinula aciculospora]|uniref:Secreted peptide n=1 Tax=Lentinula aciculospora TaxID=153920 RepID=A0A9W9ATQ6_9AGAR|nr:hypothetical protein J3R30DRAFT_69113 [Lentinula aciculospora]
MFHGWPALLFVIIATTISRLCCTTRQLMTGVERTIAVDSGMMTAIGTVMELLFLLVWRNSLIRFVLVFTLPKLYANSLMATPQCSPYCTRLTRRCH